MYKVKRLTHKKHIENLSKHTAIEVRNIVLDYLIENTYQLDFSVENMCVNDTDIKTCIDKLLYIQIIRYFDRYGNEYRIKINCWNINGQKDYSECYLILGIAKNQNLHFELMDTNFEHKMVDVERCLIKELYLLLVSTSSLINMPLEQI